MATKCTQLIVKKEWEFVLFGRLMKVKNIAETGMKWIIGKGDFDFWKDKLRGEERIVDLINSVQQPLTVKTALTSNAWQNQCTR